MIALGTAVLGAARRGMFANLEKALCAAIGVRGIGFLGLGSVRRSSRAAGAFAVAGGQAGSVWAA